MGVLGHRDFRRLWLADLASQLGSRIDVLAVPLLAATAVGASVFEVSLLRTAETLPYLVLGLQVGAWCDRMRHRPVLIAADAGRALLIASVPAAALFGALGLVQLLVVVLGAGLLGVFFDIAHQTYVPRLVPREELPEANARLQTNRSMAAVAGPGLAGLIVQALGNATALAVDAASYLWSACWLRRIATPDARPARRERRLLREIGDGLRVVRSDRILLAISAHAAVSSFFQSAHLAIVVVFLSRDVGLSPWAIGLLGTASLTGALAAGLTAGRLGARIGPERALPAAAVLFGLAYQLYPFTGPGWALACYVTAGFFSSYSVIVLSVFGAAYQQTAAPPELLGRVNSVTHTFTLGVVPLGSLLGGALASSLGMRVTLHIAAAGVLAAAAVMLWLPRRHAGRRGPRGAGARSRARTARRRGSRR
ncbi:MFS transporter [Amycolatopsis sp. NPDC051102]|uniref:MFS transporter n=1 Tax=Amycolatopsis sp. NPDC051102 TaxID=3155163 RepID=UPI0034216D71